MDTIPEHDHLQRWMCTRSSSSKDQKPDEDLAPYPDQELDSSSSSKNQKPRNKILLAPSPDQEIEELYDANWDAPPPFIPLVDLSYHDQPSNVEDEHASAEDETDSD